MKSQADNEENAWQARVNSSLSILEERTSLLDQRSNSNDAHFINLSLKLESLQRSLDRLLISGSSLTNPTIAVAMQTSSMQVCNDWFHGMQRLKLLHASSSRVTDGTVDVFLTSSETCLAAGARSWADKHDQVWPTTIN